MNKKQIFQLLKQNFNNSEGSSLDTSSMRNLSKQDAGDPKFMLELISEFAGFEDDILFYLEEPAKSDIDFIENCIKEVSKYSSSRSWSILKYASERIKNDSSVFIKWIKETESLRCLNFAEFSIQTNQEIQNLITDYLETDWNLVKYCHSSIRGDITIMKKAIAHNGLNIKFASDELKQNKKFLLSAIEKNKDAVKFIPSNFFESETFVKDLIEKVNSVTTTIFELIPEKFKKNKSILIKIAQKIESGWELEGYLDENDLEFFSEVVKKNGNFIYYASEKLRDDEELVKTAIKFGDCNLSNVSERLRNNPAMVIWAIENNRPALLRNAGEIAQDNFDVIKTAVCKQGSALDWASENLRDNDEIVKLAVDEDPYALQYASDRIRNDKAFVLNICEKQIHAYIYAGDSLWSDKDFALFVAPKVPNCLEHFSSKIQKDPDVLSIYYNEN